MMLTSLAGRRLKPLGQLSKRVRRERTQGRHAPRLPPNTIYSIHHLPKQVSNIYKSYLFSSTNSFNDCALPEFFTVGYMDTIEAASLLGFLALTSLMKSSAFLAHSS